MTRDIIENRIKTIERDRKVLIDSDEVVEKRSPTIKNAKYYTQYRIEENSIYRPSPKTIDILKPGYYLVDRDSYGTYFTQQAYSTSELIRFKNSVADSVIHEFKSFWNKRDQYKLRGESHKRGFLLWGPPGGGKTSTISFIIQDFVKEGNVVFKYSNCLFAALTPFRSIEPNRRLMVIIEDIDIMLRYDDAEQTVLQFLDGSIQHSNTIIIATTNFPEQLGDRIINRPSRFDRIAYIGLPNEEDRKIYLKIKSKALSEKEINTWAKDTKGFSFAHIKELILAVEVYDLNYKVSLKRLNDMRKKTSKSDNYLNELRGNTSFGFNKE